jgi:hypothetical protein
MDVVIIARRGHPPIGKTLDLETLKSLKQVTLIPELRALTHVDKDMVAHGARLGEISRSNSRYSPAE